MGFYLFIYIFMMAFLEELFFRALLVDHFGIFLSSLFFALMHNNYGSYYALVVAFVLGLLLSFWWKKDRNLYELFLAHFFYDIIIIWIAFFPK
jgi:membrane protease YdiL (CAAX protease family)